MLLINVLVVACGERLVSALSFRQLLVGRSFDSNAAACRVVVVEIDFQALCF